MFCVDGATERQMHVLCGLCNRETSACFTWMVQQRTSACFVWMVQLSG